MSNAAATPRLAKGVCYSAATTVTTHTQPVPQVPGSSQPSVAAALDPHPGCCRQDARPGSRQLAQRKADPYAGAALARRRSPTSGKIVVERIAAPTSEAAVEARMWPWSMAMVVIATTRGSSGAEKKARASRA